jgi:hypothetical protein
MFTNTGLLNQSFIPADNIRQTCVCLLRLPGPISWPRLKSGDLVWRYSLTQQLGLSGWGFKGKTLKPG